jgi:hypothetical protein
MKAQSQDQFYERFRNRWRETMDIPPQTVGPLTPLYKRVTSRLKIMPWPLLVTASALIVVGLFFVFGGWIIRLVSLLQRGF